jgi:hypothetical protein
MKKGLMITCKDATQLVVKRNHETLSMWDRMRLKMHLSMCRFCSLFEKQNRIIDEQVAKLDEISPAHMPGESKEKILHEIQK